MSSPFVAIKMGCVDQHALHAAMTLTMEQTIRMDQAS
jgi:hypothetical protein